jgi:hypothetical protein
MLGIDGRTRSDSRSGSSRGGLVLGKLDERHDCNNGGGGRLVGGIQGSEGNLVLFGVAWVVLCCDREAKTEILSSLLYLARSSSEYSNIGDDDEKKNAALPSMDHFLYFHRQSGVKSSKGANTDKNIRSFASVNRPEGIILCFLRFRLVDSCSLFFPSARQQ